MAKRILISVLLILIFLIPSASAMIGEEFFSIWLDLEAFDPIIEQNQDLTMKGMIRSNGFIDRVEAALYDLRLLKTEKTWLWTPQDAEGVEELSLKKLVYAITKDISAGEKRLTITAEGRGNTFCLLDQELYKCGSRGPLANISAQCTFSCSDRRREIWYDNDSEHRWISKGAQDVLTITLPEGICGEGFQVEWFQTPDCADICFIAEDGTSTGEQHYTGSSFMPLISWFDIPEGTRTITMSAPGAQVEELLIFERGKVPSMVQKWHETSEKWDLMLVSTHQDDEILFFGGAVPWYTAMGREVGVVYMTKCSHIRYKEALRGLWSCGLTNYPVFLGLRDGHMESRKAAFESWGGEDRVVSMLVEQIRRYKPEVVITHDFKGEYGHKQHIAAAYAVSRAVEAAADPAQFPDSAEKWGAWQAKKLYIHLWKEGQVKLDWNEEVPGFDGFTGMQLARRAFDKHRSQQRFVRFNLGYKYPNWLFGLYSTSVGPDETRSDLFEHIY